ncbi:phage tail tube protein [Pseudarthrobacter sp. H2]|uniref:phage tail tube protein n=1 Tax=Pseudarthrobacter sp. H2 TaxID=3418415 RepID=UPI003CE9C670
MSTTNPFIGRREGIGLGIEATPGTGVASQAWMQWLDQDIQNKTTIIENESAQGTVEKINDSAIVERWAEGKLSGKVTAETCGFLLLGMFGTVVDGTITGGVYPHTFTLNQSTVPKSLSITRVNPLETQKYTYGTVESLEISAQAGGWVEMAASVKARPGAAATETVAITAEKEFTSKDITLKTAVDVASLSGATAITAKSVKLQLERKAEAYFPLGTDTVTEFMRGSFEAKGEFIIRYTDTQVETDYLANVIKAMSIKLTNGTTTLEFTAPRARFRDLQKTSDKENVITQTVQFYCEFDIASGKAISAVLNNLRPTYV